MSYALSFGIPIAYFIVGLFASRQVFRSRHVRREAFAHMWEEDTTMLCLVNFVFWPVATPAYFIKASFDTSREGLLKRFFHHKLPESNEERAQREEQMQRKIRDLERELGLKPSVTGYKGYESRYPKGY